MAPRALTGMAEPWKTGPSTSTQAMKKKAAAKIRPSRALRRPSRRVAGPRGQARADEEQHGQGRVDPGDLVMEHLPHGAGDAMEGLEQEGDPQDPPAPGFGGVSRAPPEAAEAGGKGEEVREEAGQIAPAGLGGQGPQKEPAHEDQEREQAQGQVEAAPGGHGRGRGPEHGVWEQYGENPRPFHPCRCCVRLSPGRAPAPAASTPPCSPPIS
jgi:hypothetical protein